MDDRDPGTSPWGGVELLERAIGYTRGALALVTPELMSAPTPCAEWDVRRLLLHLDDSLGSLCEAGATHRVQVRARDHPYAEPGEPSVHTAEAIVGRIRDRASSLLGAWTADWAAGPDAARDVVVAGRPVTTAVLTSAGALEIAVHGWDLATACGVRRPLPGALAGALLRIAPVLVGPADRPGRFAAPVLPPAGATRADQLLTFLGRAVG